MKLSDNQTVVDNFFQELKDNDPTKYSNLFDDVSPSTLYYLMISKSGEKTVIELCDQLSNQELYEILLAKFGAGWEQIKSAISDKYSVFEPFSVTETITEDIEIDETKDRTGTSQSKISGFDSGQPVDDSSSSSERNETKNNTSNRTNERTKKGNNSGRSKAELLREEINVRKTSFLDIVIKDISNYLTLDVYQ